jgi:hypothetical protein
LRYLRHIASIHVCMDAIHGGGFKYRDAIICMDVGSPCQIKSLLKNARLWRFKWSFCAGV